MFAPLVNAPKAKTASQTTQTCAPKPLQRTASWAGAGLSNQAVRRLIRFEAQQAERLAKSTSANHQVHEAAPDRTRSRQRVQGAWWNFSQVPVFAPDLPSRSERPPPVLQRKVAIGPVDDPLEHEADRVADQVLRMSKPQPQPACGGAYPKCQTAQPGQEQKRLRTKSVLQPSDTGQIAAPPIVHEVLAAPGQPLDAGTRAFMEPRFGHDFSTVRVHSDAVAEQSVRAVNANAYTVGHNIVFGAGRFAPETHEGRRLLAHELTHVIQQRVTGPQLARQPGGGGSGGPDDPFTPIAGYLDETRDQFSVRREIIPDLTKRGSPPPQAKHLPSIFEDAHPWPLQWGGTEIKKGRFFATKDFNAGAQKSLENAGVRLAEFANEHNVRIRATASVTRYKERNLLERATYKFEAVSSQGKVEPLGEVTVTQSLTQKQRTALVEGTLISRPDEAVLEYRLKGELVRIDTKKLVVISSDDVFASSEERLGDFIVGLEPVTTRRPKSPRAKAAAGAERQAIVEADKKSAQRTAVDPINRSDVRRWQSAQNKRPSSTGSGGTQADSPVAEGRPPTPAGEPILPKGSIFEDPASGRSILEEPLPPPALPKGSVFEQPPAGQKMGSAESPHMVAPEPPSATDELPARTISRRVGRAAVDVEVDPRGGVRGRVKAIDLSDMPEHDIPLGPRPTGSRLQTVANIVQLAKLGLSLAREVVDEKTQDKLDHVITPIQAHFNDQLKDTLKTFHANYPDAQAVVAAAQVEEARRGYEVAVRKMQMPPNVRVAWAVLLAMTPDNKRDDNWRKMAENLPKGSVRTEDVRAAQAAAEAYSLAMAKAQTQISNLLVGMPDIIADISKRADILQSAGDDLENIFWSLMQSPLAAHPIIYMRIFEFDFEAQVFKRFAAGLYDLAREVEAKFSGYNAAWDDLDRRHLALKTFD